VKTCTPKAAARFEDGASEVLGGSACSMLRSAIRNRLDLYMRGSAAQSNGHRLEKVLGIENAAKKHQM
jgi:hypothetical protein